MLSPAVLRALQITYYYSHWSVTTCPNFLGAVLKWNYTIILGQIPVLLHRQLPNICSERIHLLTALNSSLLLLYTSHHTVDFLLALLKMSFSFDDLFFCTQNREHHRAVSTVAEPALVFENCISKRPDGYQSAGSGLGVVFRSVATNLRHLTTPIQLHSPYRNFFVLILLSLLVSLICG